MENPQHNVDIYMLILHWLKLLRKTDKFVVLLKVFYFVASNAWHLGNMVDLDIMVTRKFLGINEGIQLAKHNSFINAHLERHTTLHTKLNN